MVVAIIFLGGIAITFMVLFIVYAHKYNKLKNNVTKALIKSRSLNEGTKVLDCDYLNRFKRA